MRPCVFSTTNLLLALSLLLVGVDGHNANNSTLLLPTHEGQTVLNDDGSSGLLVHEYVSTTQAEKHILTRDFPNGSLASGYIHYVNITDDSNDRVYNKTSHFKSYEEIKSDFKKVHIGIKTDSEIIRELMTELQNYPTPERMIIIFDDLAYLLHQVDNAVNFAEDNGLIVLLDLLKISRLDVQKSILMSIAAAIQGNAKVKLIALKLGLVDQLHELTKSAIHNESLIPESVDLLSTIIISLGSLLRNFPSAQRHFFSPLFGLSPPGFEILAQIYHMNYSVSSTDRFRHLKVRVLSLLSDIYAERRTAQLDAESHPTQKNIDFWNIYAGIPFDEGFVIHGWCNWMIDGVVNDIAPGVNPKHFDLPIGHDEREKVLSSVITVAPLCNNWFNDDPRKLKSVEIQLKSLEKEYYFRSRDEKDEQDSYFNEMLQKVQKLQSMLKFSTSIPPKDEL